MTQRVLGPSGSKRRRTRLLVLTALTTAAFTVFFVGASGATLTGSSFNTSNGDLTSTATNPSLHDWNPASGVNLGPIETITCPSTAPGAGTNCGLDLTGKNTDSNGNGDNAFGQGSKEDDVSPTVVFGSIPPSKDDLVRFYVNKEFAGNKQFLYLAWERTNLLGSAHMDFEFNQLFCDTSANPTNCSANGITPLRSAGDLLFDFDFGGSGQVDLAVHKWVVGTNNPSTDCQAISSGSNVSCWSPGTDLLTNGTAEGSVNAGPVTDNNPPNNPRTLDGSTKTTGGNTTVSSTFGEAGINLTDSGAFPAGTCETLGSASLKSRSSGNSFDSELKDFIAPIRVHISNCGEIKIIKHTNPRGVDKNFTYASGIPASSTCVSDATPVAFTLNDKAGVDSNPPVAGGNVEDCTNVPTGTYSLSEDAAPAGFSFNDFSCTSSGGGSATPTSSTTQQNTSISVVGGSVTTCTYTNNQLTGAIKVRKQSTKTGNAGLAGATIHIKDPNGTDIPGSPFTTPATGVICVDGLTTFGNYSVQETAAPTGFFLDDSASHTVNVTSNNAKCTDSSFTGGTWTFNDTPKTDLVVKVTSEFSGSGGSKSSIKCTHLVSGVATDISGSPVGIPTKVNPAELDSNGLAPDTYTCTVVIDP
jgi:hypothetical protein